jgi:hypothetical protein
MALDTATLPVARNTALLSAAHASDSAMVQLSVAVVSSMLVDVIHAERLIGLGPAIVIATGTLVADPVPPRNRVTRGAAKRLSREQAGCARSIPVTRAFDFAAMKQLGDRSCSITEFGSGEPHVARSVDPLHVAHQIFDVNR